jgi:aryl-alcohol dehydrogenase-like predicted oxidoreductase
MKYRNLGTTGLSVSEVGMGCNRLGEAIATNAVWDSLVRRAADLGVNLFDTSELYTEGRSEEVLGRAIGNRDDVYIATKYGSRETADGRDWSSAVMSQAIEGSLKRLRRSAIDVYQVHSPSRADLERCDWADGMARLKKQGKIRCAAVAIGSPDDGVWLIENELVDVLQVTYNIFVTDVEGHLLPLAKERGVGTLIRMPLARGVLTGKFSAADGIPTDNRAHHDGERALERLELVDTLSHVTGAYPGGITRLAMHFSLSHPGVSCIIPGARNIAQLEQNVAASDGANLPAQVRVEIDRIAASWS